MPVLGSFHGMDLFDLYGDTDLTEYFINFVNHLDPNGKGAPVPVWPRFVLGSRNRLTFLDGNTPVTIGQDDYRVGGMELLTRVLLDTPL